MVNHHSTAVSQPKQTASAGQSAVVKRGRPGFKYYLGQAASYLVVGLILFYILFPVYWMVLSSFRSPNTVFTVNYLPTNLTPLNYRLIPLWDEFGRTLQNSFILTGGVLALTLACGSTAAYALARFNFTGRTPIRYVVLFMAAFPQIAIVGGLYVLITNPCALVGSECRSLSLYNSLAGLILADLILTLPLTVWFLSVYFKNLPRELEEAAYVDGATPWQAFFYIMLPLSLPALVTTGLLTFIIAWNEFLFALTFTIDEQSRTAPITISLMGGWGTLVDLAAAVIVTIPVVVLAVIFRQQLTAGLSGFVSLKQRAGDSLAEQTGRWTLPRLNLSIPTQIWLVMLVILLVGYLHMAASAVTFPYPLDYGEGPLLDQAVRLARFENIYRPTLDAPPYTVANYPPLFVALQAPLVWLFGPAFWYGRLISIVSAGLAAASVGLILHRLSGSLLAGVIGGLTLLAMPYLAGWSILNRVDTLALGLSLLALWLLVQWPRARWSLIAGALLLTAAIYTRQSYGLAAPLAGFVWLLSRGLWRRALGLAGLMAVVGLGLLGLLNWLTGGGFVFHTITANVNAYDWERTEWFLEGMWTFMPYLMVGTGLFVAVAGWFRVTSWWLVAPYAVGAALSALTVGKVGSNFNYFLEFSAAMSLAAGALIGWQRRRPWLQQGLIALLALQMYLLLPGIPDFLYLQTRLEQPGDMARVAEIIHQSEGTVLADDAMGFLPLTGRSIYVQPFEVTQLAAGGVWDQTPLVQDIAQQEFATIIILQVTTPFGPLQEINWSPEMLAAIKRAYRVDDVINDTIYIYKPKAPSAANTPLRAGKRTSSDMSF